MITQVGQDDVAIYLGKELLMSQELEGYPAVKGDVVLSMAIAYCNLAGDLLEGPNQASSGACDTLI